MKRIALITPMLQPYRITFYEKLSKSDEAYQWKIFHGMSRKETGRPSFKGEAPFDEKGLPEHKFFIGPFKLVYNKGLYNEVKRYNPDLVILQGIAGDLSNRRVISWAKRKGKRIILWTCGWDPGLAKGKMLAFKNFFVGTYFRKANIHLTYSSKANKYTEGMGVAPELITTCYNGIELDGMYAMEEDVAKKSADVIEKYGLKDRVTFLYVGGLIPEKKIDLLLDAFMELGSRHDNIRLLIIGDGPLKEHLNQRLEEMKDERISYLGRIIDGVDPYFAASDCLVLPGAGGLALNQAMFWRTTCIASVADGTEDDLVIDNKTGFRFEEDSLESLTAAMERRMNTSEQDHRVMGEEARKIIVERSNVNSMVEVFMKGVRDLLPLR